MDYLRGLERNSLASGSATFFEGDCGSFIFFSVDLVACLVTLFLGVVVAFTGDSFLTDSFFTD
jgi:hypothetical protein